jgi:glycosyltransferase involved in cell wall biosynthesis
MPRIRIALVGPSLRFWLGGQEVQADYLVRQWQADPAVEMRFIPIQAELPSWLAWINRIPFLRTAVRFPFYLGSLWRGVCDADIVHIFAAAYTSFILAVIPASCLARLREKKTLIHYHSAFGSDHLRRSILAARILRHCDRVVVPSQFLVGVFREFQVDASVVPNVVDSDQFRYRVRRPLRPILICSRGFKPVYRADLVVRAFARVKSQFPQAKLVLLGEGSMEAGVRSLVQEIGLEGVVFAGPVSRDRIGRFYDEADIFVQSPYIDNTPVSVLEAFVSGTAVVSTAPEGVRHMVRHEQTGLLCEPGDWQALAENVVRLLRDPDLALRVAENAHQQVPLYLWENVRGLWLDIYRSLTAAVG